MQSVLFSPLKVGSLELANRLNVPPMCIWEAADGLPSDYQIHYYQSLALSGVAMVTLEATGVTPNGRISPYCLGIWDEEHAAGIARIVKAMKAVNPEIKVLIQLGHSGRKGSCSPMDEKYVTPEKGGWEVVAPSAIQAHEGCGMPRALETSEIKDYVQAFGDAARRACEAGVDGVMIHAAHGYLIHQFLSPLSNQREDEYGGSAENRRRFLSEILDDIKAKVPAFYTVGLRISATDWLDGGLKLEDALAIADLAESKGCAFIDVSTGGLMPAPIPVAPGYQLPFAQAVKAKTQMAVFGVGLITNAFQAETALLLKACDVIDVGRAVLDDPNFGYHCAAALKVELKDKPFVKGFVR